MKQIPKAIGVQGENETMRQKATSMLLRGLLAAALISAVFAGSAGAAPVWKFEGKELTGSETIVGAAEDSTMTVPGLTTDCENFLYKVKISNSAGTGTGSVTELPLFDCGTNSAACTVESIAAEKLPWASKLTTVSTVPYIIIEGVRVGILYGGEECALSEILATVTGTAGGSIDNVTESATFNATTFKATGTSLKALGSSVEWKGLFPTEAFEWNREKALTVS
jgi:hypothetical protein